MRASRLALMFALTTMAAALVVVPAAAPAFPGRNGEIAFSIVLPTSYQGIFGDSRDLDIDICTIQLEAGLRRRITGPRSQSLWSSDAAWSSDGNLLAVTATGSFGPGIDLMKADGRDRAILLGRGRSPTWAPTNDRLAYVSPESQLKVLRVIDKSQSVLAERGGSPGWSPDGSRIAYVDTGQIAIVGANGEDRRLLTSDSASHASPSWSPDGRRIVFVSQIGGDAQPTIEVMNADGGSRAALITVRRTAAFASPDFVDPTWSPDGTKIAFVERQAESDATDVYVMSADGSGVRNLTRTPFYEFSIDWRPLPPSGFLPPGTASCGVAGTERADKLVGTVEDDVVYALAGNDRIAVAAGNDIVLADEGDDSVQLGPGDDLALGGPGRDLIDGQGGNDGLFGGAGDDRVLGSSGDDDDLEGEAGSDTIIGGSGADNLFGGRGRDRLIGGPGKDNINAGDGDDTVLVRDGAPDVIRCARGRDVVYADRQDRVNRDCERVIRR